MNRFNSCRGFLRGAGITGAAIWDGNTLVAMQYVNTAPNPSELKIMGRRSAPITRAPMTCRGDLVDSIEKMIADKSFITVPDKPGLGITLNDEVMKQHLLEPGYFEPT